MKCGSCKENGKTLNHVKLCHAKRYRNVVSIAQEIQEATEPVEVQAKREIREILRDERGRFTAWREVSA